MPAMKNRVITGLLATLSLSLSAQNPSQGTEWLTTPDRSALITKQDTKIIFRPASNATENSSITVDKSQKLQPIDGFGFALTGGSAQLIMRMTPENGQHCSRNCSVKPDTQSVSAIFV